MVIIWCPLSIANHYDNGPLWGDEDHIYSQNISYKWTTSTSPNAVTAIHTPKSLFVHVFPDIKGDTEVCVCLDFFVPLKVFPSIWDVTITWERLQNLTDVEPMVIKQWGFFSFSYLLWQKTSVYNGHLRGPVTLTPVGAVFNCFND